MQLTVNKKKISELTPVTPMLTDLVPLDRPANGMGAPITGHATLDDIKDLILPPGVFSIDETSGPSSSIINIGAVDSQNSLLVNGIDITPYSDNTIIPAGDTNFHTVMDLKEYMTDDGFGTINIEVFAGTLSTPSLSTSANAAWKLYVTLVKKNDGAKVINLTQIESHLYRGPSASSQNIPQNWDVEVSMSGIVQVSTGGADNDVAFGTIITKVSVLDTLIGNIFR